MPFNPEQSLQENKIENPKMELIQNHPICGECQSDIHKHPMPDGAKQGEPMERADCKNEGKINGENKQCHCGFGGWYINKEWVSWKDEE